MSTKVLLYYVIKIVQIVIQASNLNQQNKVIASDKLENLAQEVIK